jgi:hypothetical protein
MKGPEHMKPQQSPRPTRRQLCKTLGYRLATWKYYRDRSVLLNTRIACNERRTKARRLAFIKIGLNQSQEVLPPRRHLPGPLGQTATLQTRYEYDLRAIYIRLRMCMQGEKEVVQGLQEGWRSRGRRGYGLSHFQVRSMIQ